MDKPIFQDITIVPYTALQKPTSNSFLGLATTLRHIVPIQANNLSIKQPIYNVSSTGGTTPLFLNSPLPSPQLKAIHHQKENTDIDEEGIFALTELNNHNITMVSSPQNITTSTSIIVGQHTIPLATSPTATNDGLAVLPAVSGSTPFYTQERDVIASLGLDNHYTHHHHPPANNHHRPHKRSSPEDDDSDNNDGDSGRGNPASAQAVHRGRLSDSWGHYITKGKPNQYKRQRRDNTNDVTAATALPTSSPNPSTPSRETSVGSVLVPEEGSTQAPAGADTAVQEQQPAHRFPSLPPITSIGVNQRSRENSVNLRIAAARAARGRSRLEDGEIDSVYGDMPADDVQNTAVYAVPPTKRLGTTNSNGLEEGEIRSDVGAYADRAANANASQQDLPMLTTTTATKEMYGTEKLEHDDTPWSAGSNGSGEREMSQDLASLSLGATREVAAPPSREQEKWTWQQASTRRDNNDAYAKTSPQREGTEPYREKAEWKKQSTIPSPTRLPQVEVVISIPPPRVGLRRSSTGTTTSTHTITTSTPREPRPLTASGVVALPTAGHSSHDDVDMNLDPNDDRGEETDSDDSLGIRFPSRKPIGEDKGKEKEKEKEVAAQPRQSSPVGSVVSISSNDKDDDDSDIDDDVFVVGKGKGKARQAMMIRSPDVDISDDDDDHMEQVDHQPEEMDPEGEQKWLDFIGGNSDEDTSQAVNVSKTVVQKNNKDNRSRADKRRTKDIRQQSRHRRTAGARGGERTTNTARTHVASAKRSAVGNTNARAGPSNARRRVAQPVSPSSITRSGNDRAQARPSKTWKKLVLRWKEVLERCYDENGYEDESPPSFGNAEYYAIKETLDSIEEMKDQIPVDCLGYSYGVTPMISKMKKNLAVEYTIRKQAEELHGYLLERWQTKHIQVDKA